MPEPIYQDDDEVVVDETQAWVIMLVGSVFWFLAFVIAVTGVCFAPVSWPLAGILGAVSTLIGIVSLNRAQRLQREKGAEGAMVAMYLGGLLNSTMGLIMLMVGMAGLALMVFYGAIIILVAIAD